jgi:hypothetical protein
VWRARAIDGWRRGGGRIVVMFALAWAVTGGYWYVRNILHTGNPVYPAAFAFWPGTTFPQTTLREYAQHYGFLRAVNDALAVYLNWPRFHAALGVAALLGLAGWRGVRRRTITQPQVAFCGGALTILILTLMLLPDVPYSAGNGMTFAAGLVHWDSMRYIALLPILGWVALAFLLDAGAGASLSRTLAGLAVIVGALVTSQLSAMEVVIILVVGAVGAAVIALAGDPSVRTRRIATAVAAVAVLAFVTASHGAKAAATAAAFHRESLFGAAAAIIDRQPGGTRVAAYGDQWIYPMFGPRHDLVPVRLDRNGRIATEPIGDAMTQGDPTVDLWTFRRSLAASSIGLVAVVHLPHPGRSPQWPAQATLLENAPGARLLYRDGGVALWKLGD